VGAKTLQVVLVTADESLAALAERLRPPAARLICASPDNVESFAHGEIDQWWLDLDAGAHTGPEGLSRYVFFYSGRVRSGASLPRGIYIRKPCTERAMEVLWATAVSNPPHPAPPPAPRRAESPAGNLPAWTLAFHELDGAKVSHACVTLLAEQLGFRAASLYRVDAERGLFTLSETTAPGCVELTIRADARPRHRIAGVAADARPLRCDDLAAACAARRWRAPLELPERGAGPALLLPLTHEGEVVAVVELIEPTGSTAIEIGLPIPLIAECVGRSLHHAAQYDACRNEARQDELTGLFNSRWVSESLDREIQRADRFGRPLSLILLDLDGLKPINDSLGHLAGDAVLRYAAGRIRMVLRQIDAAARVGGDEFVILLPETDLAGAHLVAERLLAAIRSDAPRFNGSEAHITASLGAAEWVAPMTGRELLHAADAAMYAAKNEGRNRVCSGADRPPTGLPVAASGDPSALGAGR